VGGPAWKVLCGCALASGVVLAPLDVQLQVVSPGYRTLPPRDDFSLYPKNYADQAAQTLGISRGQINILSFGSGRNQEFNLRGGVDHGVPTLKLQWPSN